MAEKYTDKILTKLKIYWGYLLIFFTILFLISLWRNLVKINQAKSKIREAQERVEKLRKENNELASKLEIVKSDEYKEKQIRNKLGLAKEGETVIVLPDEETLRKFAPHVEEEPEVLPDPNWKKWAHLFGF